MSSERVAIIHNSLGLALHSKRYVELAAGHYRKAIDVEGQDPRAHNNLGVAMQDLGQVEEANSEVESCWSDLSSKGDSLTSAVETAESNVGTAADQLRSKAKPTLASGANQSNGLQLLPPSRVRSGTSPVRRTNMVLSSLMASPRMGWPSSPVQHADHVAPSSALVAMQVEQME